jgi:hypothetical protein
MAAATDFSADIARICRHRSLRAQDRHRVIRTRALARDRKVAGPLTRSLRLSRPDALPVDVARLPGSSIL